MMQLDFLAKQAKEHEKPAECPKIDEREVEL